ncbi:MAG TPA: excinuclease ABC subunit UvrA [Bacteroidales bacterium]|nr:excinuclease ABC subunit UvrA [Bacteroidales bacterium]HSA42645.1 excinuclease ABC subunit UvrA [Bacteroidales bacterium]
MWEDLSKLDPHEFILIKGARVHNLKGIDVAIPRNKFVVITGLSGSGKSSLAFDTLYAEGQRRYVESLSAYARQFLGRMNKPEVDYIKGISPAIAIEQKVNTRNPRSTVGTSTEIYEYIKLLFARIGRTFSPVSGELVKRDTPSSVKQFILSLPEETRVVVYSPLVIKNGRSIREQLLIVLQQGFSRVVVKDEQHRIEDLLAKDEFHCNCDDCLILIDRFVIKAGDEDISSRAGDSVETAFFEGEGSCIVAYGDNVRNKRRRFSNRFEADGIQFEEPSVNLFSFNNPYGACKRCEGFGSIIGIDEDLVIPNKSLSIYDEAIACWKGDKMSEFKNQLLTHAWRFNFPIHKPVCKLSKDEYELLWTGNEHFTGLNDFFRQVEEQTYKIQYRVMLSRYRGKTVCPDCKGTRLRADASWVKVAGYSILDIVLMPVEQAFRLFSGIKLNEGDRVVAKRLLIEIITRLRFLCDVGLGYLTLNRLSSSLSGGESQRINLATSLGSSLVGSMYILDEPSIGLHPRDTRRLIEVLHRLRDLGNTVIVVEHDEEIIRAADVIIDLGPLAGTEGGELVFAGDFNSLQHDDKSLTAKYINHVLHIPMPGYRRKWKNYLEIIGAKENNLKNIDVEIPLNLLCVITGVSGSGKTSLVKHILYPALKKIYGGYGDKTGRFDRLQGDIKCLGDAEMVDQNPIGRSSRSNPATYVKAYDDIRTLFAEQSLSRVRGYKPGYFSFNIPGGRCEECEGDGTVSIEMQFMADITLVCESCGGKRFKEEVLDVKYDDHSITDILELTIDQAVQFFGGHAGDGNIEKKIVEKLKPLQDVGLGYLRLGQPSSTLSGGEAQRIKLAYFLARGNTDKPTLFIFDEPTTGLHFHDISKLIRAFQALIDKGHSLVVIEHNMEVIKCADWIIDLGPEGGEAGGQVVFAGVPEDLIRVAASFTGSFLKKMM